ncbi:V-type proton ATPase subunit C 1-B-like [Cimex lectularius]|uniref:V-type proton ATPase subunit C n=1 Tax=Cimex lectularius TaxID=79782 RepID=A0A8I6SFY5_CIMLE|nr:V-type proton ATPase subunit C 1-B-like [Cimex lectularius]
MFDYWIISVPADPTCDDTWRKLVQALAKYNDCACFKFYIPTLKAGTLDQLLLVSDDLARLETNVENTVNKIAAQLDDLLENKREEVVESIHADNVTLHHYLITFKWDMAKYPTRQSIKTIAYLIEKQMSICDVDLNTKTKSYNTVVNNYAASEKKRVGNLLTKYIGDYVSKEDFVLQSEFLTTLVVVVPCTAKESWLNKYERLNEDIVPKSTKLVKEDNEHALFTVTLFKKSIEPFKLSAKQSGFFVRDFVYNEQEIFEFRRELYELYQEKQKLYQPFLKFCISNFSECFIALIHVKSCRVFVESVLRYGLPANFQPILLVIPHKISNKVRRCLDDLYGHLDTMRANKSQKKNLEPSAILEQEYYPYVFTKIKAEIGDILIK